MRLLFAIALAACSPQLQTVELVNKTSRQLESVFVYPLGAADHGASRGGLAPNATTSVQLAKGNYEVLAVGVKVQIDEHTRDKPSVSGAFEVHGPPRVPPGGLHIVFYDVDAKPPEVDHEGVIGVPFTLRKSNTPTDDHSPMEPLPSSP